MTVQTIRFAPPKKKRRARSKGGPRPTSTKAPKEFPFEQERLALIGRGIDPEKRIWIRTRDGRTLRLTSLNAKNGIATCRTARNTVRVKFSEIDRLAGEDERPPLPKGINFD